MTFDELATSHCKARSSEDALDDAAINDLLALVTGWERVDGGHAIARDFPFKDFHHTLGFVNAVGYLANHEDHHPDLEAGYGHCRVRWSTHDADGLSMNDFICAAKVEALLR
ncbi:MAG TPA: 4a-hydroxytetrahydrobiopterin dehydratase [Oleiagrimonas sp.]|nr:4a-hydroxytetrahydrobiopterin dehydratase [Oleiagrimonas sp.]